LVGQADILCRQRKPDDGRRAAALTDEGDAGRRRVGIGVRRGKRNRETVEIVGEGQAIRTEHRDAGIARHGCNLILQCASGVAQLSEARGIHDGCAYRTPRARLH